MKYLLSIFTILIFLGSYAVGQNVNLSKPGLLPNHPLIVFQEIFERFQLIFAFSPEAKANVHLQLAEKRLSELNLSISENKTNLIPALAKKFEKEINETEDELKSTASSGRNVTKLAEHVAKETFKHSLVLESVLEKVPDQAKDNIEKAREASGHGHRNAVKRILQHENITGLVNITFTIRNQTFTQTFNVTEKDDKTRVEIESEHIETCEEECENETVRINPAGKRIGQREHENEEENETTTTTTQINVNATNTTLPSNSTTTTTSISNITQTTTTTHGKSGESGNKSNSTSSEND